MSKRLTSLLLLLTLITAVSAGDFTVSTNSEKITIVQYVGSGGPVIVPATINGLPVTAIGDFAFSSCSNVTSVTIPDSVASIGRVAFRFCSGLTEVKIGGSVSDIGDMAFFLCRNLTNVAIPNSVTNIAEGAFRSCSSLATATIGSGVATLGHAAFGWCTNLTRVYFRGNAPRLHREPFPGVKRATVYYQPGTTGWGPAFAGRPTAEWKP